MLNKNNILISRKVHTGNSFGSKYINVSTDKNTLATAVSAAEGQLLLEGQTLNKAKSLIYRADQQFPKENDGI
jgi:ABC-type iron transport system FetAB ATPase subunit